MEHGSRKLHSLLPNDSGFHFRFSRATHCVERKILPPPLPRADKVVVAPPFGSAPREGVVLPTVGVRLGTVFQFDPPCDPYLFSFDASLQVLPSDRTSGSPRGCAREQAA